MLTNLDWLFWNIPQVKQRGNGSKLAQHFWHKRYLLQEGINAFTYQQKQLCFSCIWFAWLCLGFLNLHWPVSHLLKASKPFESPPLSPFLQEFLRKFVQWEGDSVQTHVTDTPQQCEEQDWPRSVRLTSFGAYCKSFGNMPFLCEYPHLSTGCLIMNSLMWCILSSVWYDNHS